MTIGDTKNFVINDFFFQIEYRRINFDCFGRVRKTNEAKIKHFLLSYLLIKLVFIEILGPYEKTVETKPKPPITLVIRQLASSLYYIFYQLIKKNVKVVQNNDSKFDEEDPNNRKPIIRDKDVIDKNVKPSEWYKTKKQSEEQPPIRDILDYDLLAPIFKDVPELSTQMATGMEQMINTIYNKFFPVFTEVKNQQISMEKAKVENQKEELQEELQKSVVSLLHSKSARSISQKGNPELQPPIGNPNEDAESFKDDEQE